MDYQKNFADRLSELRSTNRISTNELGCNVGVSKQAISQFEKCTSYPHFRTLCSLADFFNVSIDYLVGRTDNPEVNR